MLQKEVYTECFLKKIRPMYNKKENEQHRSNGVGAPHEEVNLFPVTFCRARMPLKCTGIVPLYFEKFKRIQD